MQPGLRDQPPDGRVFAGAAGVAPSGTEPGTGVMVSSRSRFHSSGCFCVGGGRMRPLDGRDQPVHQCRAVGRCGDEIEPTAGFCTAAGGGPADRAERRFRRRVQAVQRGTVLGEVNSTALIRPVRRSSATSSGGRNGTVR